jgi:hypothetical protein
MQMGMTHVRPKKELGLLRERIFPTVRMLPVRSAETSAPLQGQLLTGYATSAADERGPMAYNATVAAAFNSRITDNLVRVGINYKFD